MFRKNFLFFLFSMIVNCFSLNIEKKKPFNIALHKKLTSMNIYEPHVCFIFFENSILLIGAISDFKNFNKIFKTAQHFATKFNKKTKIINFLIYEVGSMNPRIFYLVRNEFDKQRFVSTKNYQIFVMHHTVWIIGNAKTCYEKNIINDILFSLKKRGIIKDYYCFIKYLKNYKRGFLYRHKV